jgi:hypothetical protein
MSNYWLDKTQDEVAKQGDLTSTPWQSVSAGVSLQTFCPQTITFTVNKTGKETEVLRLSPEGFFVGGRKVEDDRGVYEAMCRFLTGSGFMKEQK